jgi:uncharacterized membrane protein
MKNRYLWVSLVLIVIAAGATVALFGQLPERMPLHWDLDGQVDRFGPRASAFLMPALMAAILGLLALLPRWSPQRFSVDAFSDTYWYCAMLVVLVLGFAQAMMLWSVLGGDSADTPRVLVAGIALFTALLGNVMGKVRRNFWLGVRTPWTLANDRVWYSTHRLAARTMVAGSVVGFAVALGGRPGVAVGIIGVAALAPAVYSLLYYKRLERSGGLEA